MTYLYAPHYVTEIKMVLSLKLSNGGERVEELTITSERAGTELVNQLADTILSAMHLATARVPDNG